MTEGIRNCQGEDSPAIPLANDISRVPVASLPSFCLADGTGDWQQWAGPILLSRCATMSGDAAAATGDDDGDDGDSDDDDDGWRVLDRHSLTRGRRRSMQQQPQPLVPRGHLHVNACRFQYRTRALPKRK